MRWNLGSNRTRIAAHVVLGLLVLGCDDDTVIYDLDDPPAVPTGVTTVTGDGWVDVYWNPVREEDVVGYGVYRSSTLEGPYHRIATVNGRESNFHRDTGLTNGVTIYYAVDAFDRDGDESELSYEDVFDTPRPAGANLFVFARQESASQSGIDFSDYNLPSFVTAYNAADTDIYMQRVNGVLFAKGTFIGGYWNDIQDLGWTETMDDVSWSPTDGWSVSADGVELIEGHTYVVWTWESYFAKFRVVEITESTPGSPSGARIDWAYQIDQNNPELLNGYTGHRRNRDDSGRDAS